MQKEQLSQAKENATLAADNKHLIETNERLEKEIVQLRADRKESNSIIVELRRELDALKAFVKNAHPPNEALKIQIVEADK